MQDKVDGLNSNIQENITNVRVVKSFVRRDFEIKKFRKSNGDLKHAGMSAMLVMICMQPVMTLLMNLTTVSVLWLGGRLVMNGAAGRGSYCIYHLYYSDTYVTYHGNYDVYVFHPVQGFSRRISEVLDENADITDENALYKDRVITSGKVEFKNVGFRYYKTSEGKVLDNISLTINPGETVGYYRLLRDAAKQRLSL